jgi:hypothetical protein
MSGERTIEPPTLPLSRYRLQWDLRTGLQAEVAIDLPAFLDAEFDHRAKRDGFVRYGNIEWRSFQLDDPMQYGEWRGDGIPRECHPHEHGYTRHVGVATAVALPE